MHFDLTLTDRIAAGAVRDKDLSLEVVEKIGGGTVRNQLWDEPRRTWELPFPPMQKDDPDFKATMNLADVTGHGAHTFDFFDELDEEWIKVRFDGKLKASHVAGPWYKIEPVLLVEDE